MSNPGKESKKKHELTKASTVSEASQHYIEVSSTDSRPNAPDGPVTLTPPALKEKGYNLTTLLGQGGFSKVYRCNYSKMGDKEIAVKVINLEQVPLAWKDKCLKIEMKIIQKLQHPHIIKVWEVIKTKRNVYIFMDLAENDSVHGFMKKQQRPCKEDEAKTWFSQTMGALKYMHERQVAHRDLKCENILLDRDFNAKLTDFGFACYTYDEKAKTTALQMTTCGTPEYQAPEVFNPPYDAKISDMWSMGVVLYEMLTFERPFPPGLPPRKLLQIQMKKQWQFPAEIDKRLKPTVKDLTAKLMDPVTDTRLNASGVLKHPWMK